MRRALARAQNARLDTPEVARCLALKEKVEKMVAVKKELSEELTDAGEKVTNECAKLSLLQDTRARKLLQQAIRTDGSKPYNRSPLMFVGEGRAGKTSTVRSLLGQSFGRSQAQTVGAETKTCTIERRQHVRRWQEAQGHRTSTTVRSPSVSRCSSSLAPRMTTMITMTRREVERWHPRPQ